MQPIRVGQQPHSHVALNKVIAHLLCSPLHPLISRNLMLITYTGRKSGQCYTIPVTYVQRDDAVIVFSNQRWWRNLEGGAPVTLQLRGRSFSAIGQPTRDPATIVEALKAFFMQKGVRRAWMINVEGLDPRRAPTEAELERSAQTHVVIQFRRLEPTG